VPRFVLHLGQQGQLAAERRRAGYNPEAMRRMKEIFWQGTEGWDALLAERAGISGELVLSDFTRKAITR
jgi:methylglutaconyl-CoA hydratase